MLSFASYFMLMCIWYYSLQLMAIGETGDNGVLAVSRVVLVTEHTGVSATTLVHRMAESSAKVLECRRANATRNPVRV